MSDYPGYQYQHQYQNQPYQQPAYLPTQPYAQMPQPYPSYPPTQAYQPVYGTPAPQAYAVPSYPQAYPQAYPQTYAAPAYTQSYQPAPSYTPTPYSATTVNYHPSYAPSPHAIALPIANQPVYQVTPVAAPMMAAGPAVAYPAMNYLFQFKGLRFDRQDLFSQSDPFLVLCASRHPGGYLTHRQAKQERKSTRYNKKFGVSGSGNWVMIHKTETIMNNQNPLWNPFVVNLYSLCGGNFDTPFKIEVWDSDFQTNHDFIGSAVVTMRELSVLKEVRLTNKRRIRLYGDCSGMLEVLRCAPSN